MGGKYSKVVNPYFPALKVLEGLSLANIQGKIAAIAQSQGKSGVYFLSKGDVAWSLDRLNEIHLYQILSLFDVSKNGNIPSLDFWGALVLLSADENDNKINHCFKLMDLNHDDYLSYSDLVIAMVCMTRGVANIRGYRQMPHDFIDKMVVEIFRVCKKTLNENAEISLLDFRTVLLSDDLVGQYLSNLGVPVVEVDAAALVTKRSNLLKEAMIIRSKISETMCALAEHNEQEEQFGEGRGGDVELVRLSEEDIAANQHRIAVAIEAELRQKRIEKGLPPEATPFVLSVGNSRPSSSPASALLPTTSTLTAASNTHSYAHSANAVIPASTTKPGSKMAAKLTSTVQASRPGAPSAPTVLAPEHPARKFLKGDNSVFVDADMSLDKKAAHGYFGEGFRTGLLEVWKKLPQDEDLMAELDAHTVIALFDNVTVTLTYADAMHCLQHLEARRSIVNRYHFDDVLKWFLLYGIDLSVKTVRRSSVAAVRGGETLSLTSLSAQMVPLNATSESDKWTEFTHSLSTQFFAYSHLLTEGVRRAAYLRRVLDGIDQLVPNRTLKYGNFAHPERAALALTASSKNNRSMGAGGGAKDVNFMQKLVEFRKILSRKPSTVIMKYVFNHPNVKILPKAGPEAAKDNKTSTTIAERGRPGSRGRNNARGAAASSRSRSRGRSPGKSPGNSRPNSQGGGAGGEPATDPSHTLNSPSTKANTSINATTTNTTTTTPGKASSTTAAGGAPLIGPQLSEAEQLPPTKIIRIEEIDDWKLTFKLALTSNPFSNLATKRTKENSRVKHVAGRFYIEDFANLQAQDLLDFYNLQQEKWLDAKLKAEEEQVEAAFAALEAAEGENSTAVKSAKLARSFTLGGFSNMGNNNNKKKQKPEPIVFNSVIWFCIQLKTHLAPEQEALFVTALKNFFLCIPMHLRESLYNEVYIQIFSVFKSDNTGTANKASERVAGKFLSSMLGKGDADSTAEADAVFLSAPRVILVGLYHNVDHFQELEKSLVNSDVFLTRAVSSAVLDVQLMQTLAELMERGEQYAYYSEKLFGPQEEELGEERMNPLTFAKEMRTLRRHFADLAQNAKTFNRAELSQHCRELGLKDSGTLAELVKRVREGYEEQADLVGYGELSKFGEHLVAKIFHMFKIAPIYRSDEDGGLSLWEFNKLLYQINAPTLYDPVQYQRLVKELDLLVDRDLRLRLAGLQAYYRSNGRLKQENDLFGVGSLDEHLSGRFLFSSTFEPDALASLLNLLGSNSLFIPELLKVLTRIASIKELKVESELDRLSEFFKLLDLDTGKWLNKEVLLNPGWLGRMFNELSAHLADGDNGVLPAMRAHVRAHFGKYDQWERLLSRDLIQLVQLEREGDERIAELRALQHTQNLRLQRRAEREREAAERQRMMDLIANGGSAEGEMSVAGRDGHAGDGGSLADSITQSDQPSYHSRVKWGGGNREDAGDEEEEAAEWLLEGENDEEDEGEFEVIDYDAQIDALLLEDQAKVISGELPPVPKSDIDLPKTILQLKKDLIFLHNIRNVSNIELSLEESNAIFERKSVLVRKIAEAQRMVEENEALVAAHSCAVYDCFRVLAVGLSSAGLGSRDFCLRGYADGLDIAQYLPRGMGELSPAKQALAEKVERAAQRKASALAALERVKRRRNMTDEEKEELLREQRAAQLLAWAKEENEMFSAAFAALCNAREERKSTAEIGQMVALWEALVVAKEKRYPTELATAVCQNNLACILLEFYGTRHPKGAPGQYLFETAVNSLSTILEELEHEVEEAKEKADIRNWPVSPKKVTSLKPVTTPVGGSASAAKTFVFSADADAPPRDPVASINEIALQCMLISVNYITTLLETESTGKLQQSIRIKHRLYDMYNNLSERDQEKLAQSIVPVVSGMPVFAYVNVRTTLTKVVDEMEQYLETRAKRAAAEAEEALRLRLEEEEALRLESSVHEGSVKSLDPKIARREKKAKYAAQRKLDAIKRVEVTKQRQALYEMIQTDRITTIFNARAHGAEASNTPGWGEENEHEMTRLSDEMNALTATLVGESARNAAIGPASSSTGAAALPAAQGSP